MEWLDPHITFSKHDLSRNFKFNNGKVFELDVVRISRPETVVEFELKTLTSEREYQTWISELSLPQTTCPTLLLIIHKRRPDDSVKCMSLPYGKATFQQACKGLFQHRSICRALERKSAVFFNSRSVNWGLNTPGRSSVYLCKSDTESLTDYTDIILSTTCFNDIPLTYAVVYGCTPFVTNLIEGWLRTYKELAFHPLILPMIFLELERKRLLNAIDDKASDLGQRILDMEKRLERERQTDSTANAAKGKSMIDRECETIRMWLAMSDLKNALKGLTAQLSSIHQQLSIITPSSSAHDKRSDFAVDIHDSSQQYAEGMEWRLREMMLELESRIRGCDGLLGGITLATQMEWNYFTRTEFWVNFTIAKASKRDSTHMRQISLMGMLFLPGTFLATLFSMTFFNWTPSETRQIISPWVALYFGLTAILTAGTVAFWKSWSNKEEKKDIKADERFLVDLEKAMAWASMIKPGAQVQDAKGSIEMQSFSV